MFSFCAGGGETGTGRQVRVAGGIPAGVMCLKSITPIARISARAKESVCLFPLKT